MKKIGAELKTQWLGRVYQHIEETASTNSLCREEAEKGGPMGLVIAADTQTEGRGRNGRPWASPQGGLWFSLLLRPSLRPEEALALIPVTAVGLCRGLLYYPGLGAEIKWPNDILSDGKKLCGVLSEMKAEKDKLHYVVIGIGVNLSVSGLPAELNERAVGMEDILGIGVDKKELLCRLLLGLESAYDQFFKGQKDMLFAEWKENTSFIGKEMTVKTAGKELTGKALGLTDDGFLLLDIGNGKGAKIISGDLV